MKEFDDCEEEGDDKTDDGEDVAKVEVEDIVKREVLDEECVDVEFEYGVMGDVETEAGVSWCKRFGCGAWGVCE